MSFSHGKMYTVKQLYSSHPHWQGVSDAVKRRTKPGTGRYKLIELYSVKWRVKPFPWSYGRHFKPNRRWFYHGTAKRNIQKILDTGFLVGTAAHGRMLGDGIYATYHTNKGRMYGSDNYVVSVMVCTPKRKIVHPQQSITQADISFASSQYQAIEVRTNAIIRIGAPYPMKNHEICIFDPRRIIPRFILRLADV